MKRMLAVVLGLMLVSATAQAAPEAVEANVAAAVVSVDAGAGMMAQVASEDPAQLEATMRGIYARVSAEDFDGMVDGAVEKLSGEDKPAEAELVRNLAAKIKKPDEDKDNALGDLPLDFMRRTTPGTPSSGS